MKKTASFVLASMIAALLIGCSASFDKSASAQEPVAMKEESLADYRERMEWFAEAQYGMFIHFGLYSQLGGAWEGEEAWVYAEWIQAGLDIPSEEYVKLIDTFNPTGFDADKIVRAAKEAGMTYLVITAKHHEGFCLWDSDYTDFDVASSPFAGRDLLAELKAACDQYGIKFGLYYSIIDWNHPTQKPERGSRTERFVWKHLELVEGREQEYFDYQTNQVLELIEKYDPVIMWFDGDWADWWTLEEGVKLYNAIRNADPDIIVNNRVAKRDAFEADYVTQEQRHFEDVFPKYWEGCYTMNDSWGYKTFDDDWKDAETVYNKLKDINEKGGSLLLNVGPDGNGVVQDEAYAILAETAELLGANPIQKNIPEVNKVPGVIEDSARAIWRFIVGRRYQDRPAFAYVENDPALPNVLLYGDSISIGYTPEVRSELDGEANVYRIHKNGAHSAAAVPWLKDLHTAMRDPLLDAPWTFDWDVIHFNVGLHDLTYRVWKDINDRYGETKRDKVNGELQTTIEDYKTNFRSMVDYLRELAPEATLIFATTTPVPEGEPGRIAGDAERYNQAALEVLGEYPEVEINDLHALIKPRHAEYWSEPGNVHYNELGSKVMGQQVAEAIRAALP
jgi:alpha-L-fucosidase